MKPKMLARELLGRVCLYSNDYAPQWQDGSALSQFLGKCRLCKQWGHKQWDRPDQERHLQDQDRPDNSGGKGTGACKGKSNDKGKGAGKSKSNVKGESDGKGKTKGKEGKGKGK